MRAGQPVASPPALTEAPLPGLVLATALPTVGSVFLQLTFNIADTFWVGRTLGATALAAVSTAGFYVWMVLALGEMLSVGLTAVAARRHGEAAAERAAGAAAAALGVAGVGGIAVGGTILIFLEGLFRVMRVPPDVAELGARFLRVYALGIPFVFGSYVIEAAFRSAGDTRTPFRLLASASAVNLLLTPLLIVGAGPLPRLGIAGAAAAAVATRGTVCALGIAVLISRGLVALRRPDWRVASTVLAVGLPAAATGVLFSVVYVLLTRVTARYGTPALAALGVGHKIEGLAYFTGVGFALAAAAIVGQNLGAQRVDRARRAGWVAAGYTSLATGVVAALYLAFPEPLVRVFVADPAVVDAGAMYLRIMAPSTVAQGVELVLEGALGGAGYTLWPFVWSTALTASRLPLAMLSSPIFGLAGIWWTLSLTAAGRGVVMAALWHRAPWRRKVV